MALVLTRNVAKYVSQSFEARDSAVGRYAGSGGVKGNWSPVGKAAL